MPMLAPIEERIQMATVCRDADNVPKVPDAGSVVTTQDGTRVQMMHNGLLVIADGYCGSWMTDLIARCRGHHEPQEERVFHEILSRLPDNSEQATLEEILAQARTHFTTNPTAAEEFLSLGNSPRDASLKPADLAAWSAVMNVVLNLDECISKL